MTFYTLIHLIVYQIHSNVEKFKSIWLLNYHSLVFIFFLVLGTAGVTIVELVVVEGAGISEKQRRIIIYIQHEVLISLEVVTYS